MFNILRRKREQFAKENLFAKFPWLWAIRLDWNTKTLVQVSRVNDKQFLSYDVPDTYGLRTCYIHTATSTKQAVHKVSVFDKPFTMYDALAELKRKNLSLLGHVRHLAVTVNNMVDVYEAKDTTFEVLFMQVYNAKNTGRK